MTARFREKVEARSGFELVREPQSINVCFLYVPDRLRSLSGERRRDAVATCTTHVRAQMTEQGQFLLNYATVDGSPAYRMGLVNTKTTEEDMAALLDEIERLSEDI